MPEILEKKTALEGSEFIVDMECKQTFFTPDKMDEEQTMIVQTVKDFVRNEIWPITDRIEKQEEGLAPSLLKKMGDLGLLCTHMPEEYGGMDLDFNTNTLITEGIGPAGAFSVTYNAHTGIGMLPILYFGTDAQKEKYLPKLATGEKAACYCLTEPSSGSDALAAKTKAILSEDGKHYLLNGQKMWISNAGFAEVFTLFAKVDGVHFTGFILEKGMEGLTLGAEEEKLGIKGSSTRQVFLENVKVPVENVLGAVGKGHLIAFNVLNTGRFKLGASCLGGAKEVITTTVKYALERKQFQKPIASFGAIQTKIADQIIQAFVTESGLYRCSDLINNKIKAFKADGVPYAEAKLRAAEEYALESSVIKIQGSEALDFIVDEGVQVHGGMGYSEEGTIARAYRDSRINRIFEGTNEINRLVIMNTLFKKAMSGNLDIATPAMSVQSELMNGATNSPDSRGSLTEEFKALLNFKKVLQMLLGVVGQEAMSGKVNLKEEQELLMSMADLVIDVYNVESTLLRAEEAVNTKAKDWEVYQAIIKNYTFDANARIAKTAFDVIGIIATEDLIPMYAKGVKMLTKYPIQNIKSLKRQIAAEALKAEAYPLV